VPNPCPTGRGALAGVPELAGDPFLARQPAVSGPKIDEMVVLMRSGRWDWTGREVTYNGNVIVDGHHRYVAARLARVEPVMVPNNEPVARTFGWERLFVDAARWPGGY